MIIENVTVKILKENIGKKIKFKMDVDYILFRFGTIEEVSGRTKEFYCGSDWNSINRIKHFEIL